MEFPVKKNDKIYYVVAFDGKKAKLLALLAAR